ncbi:MAG: ABC transporter ATP-binding protein [Mollicutes bacterium]|nr:ABC transporter ATP-binding protein [Mollicutes bacterium]
MKDLVSLIKYLKPYKKWALLAPLLVLLEVVMELMLPKIMANIVNIGIGGSNIDYILWNVFLMIILSIVGIIGGIGSIYFATMASESTVADIREDLFTKINSLSLVNFSKLKTGQLITILTNDTYSVSNLITMVLRFLFRVPIILVGSIIMALIISPQLSLILLFMTPILLIVAILIIKKVFPYFTIIQKTVDDVNAVVRENIGGIQVVKSFVMEDYEIEKFDKINKKMMDVVIRAMRFVVLAMPLMMLFINMATVLVLWYGGKLVMIGDLEIGSIIAFTQYLTNILMSLLMISMGIAVTTRSVVSAKRINEIFALTEDVKELDNPIKKEKIEGKVEFKNVSFSYEQGSGDAVLNDINFVVEKGKKVAILGPTGSGKSTVAALIARFYDPTEGVVLIDDIDIRKYSLKTLRKNIAVVFQKTVLFSDSIRNNIKYGRRDATDDEVVKVSKIAQAHDFITKKEEGYDYVVEQGAVNLSGGQKQRLSLARALIMDAPILILDDTTSALDLKTEKKIRTTLKKELADKTVFIITQRIATALDADMIIVLDDGKISGIGNHDTLIKTNEVYKSIYESQIKSKKDVVA